MPLPPQIDTKIVSQIESMLDVDVPALRESIDTSKKFLSNVATSQKSLMIAKLPITDDKFDILKARFLGLLDFLSVKGKPISQLVGDIRTLESTVEGANALLGKVQVFAEHYKLGLLDDLIEIVEANVAADYMGQAEALLAQGQSGQYDHVPAAVLAGAVLEDNLRRLCDRQTPPIPTFLLKPNGSQDKMMDALIDDLAKVGVLNKTKVKNLRWCAGIRNDAAHGNFGNFNRQDVVQMLAGVQNFLAEHM